MKSYTDLSQAKALSKILPLESADMHYCLEQRDVATEYEIGITPFIKVKEYKGKCNIIDVQPSWSLAALLGVLPMIRKCEDTANPFIAKTPDCEYYVVYATLTKEVYDSSMYDNPVDACVEMVINLHKLNLL